MKKLLATLLCVLILLPLCTALAEDLPPELYTARARVDFTLYAEPDGQTRVGYVPVGKRITLRWTDPCWALITYNGVTGYARRSCVEEASPLNSTTTPPYGVEKHTYIATIAAADAPVTSAAGGGDTLITLHAGARVAFIGFEDGYGKLIYHRQYGYIDTRHLTEILPVASDLNAVGAETPLAAYVSFYKITTDEANLGRMENLRVGGERLERMTLQFGDNLNFNRDIGPYSAASGYKPAIVLVDGGTSLSYGGGTCQVSSTLYNAVLQLPGLTVLQRRAHGPAGATYLPHGVDAAVGTETINFRFRNDYPFAIKIDAHAQDGALYIAIYRTKE